MNPSDSENDLPTSNTGESGQQIGGSSSEKPGDRIGRYKLREKIGEGGCGIVYVADQEEPVRRRVALKIIKLGMDTKQVVARFEAERQALALMDHVNIAKVLDAGATDTGRPYFVMELVRGIRITDYCDQNKLSTHERLNLFVQVCHAIQHAHQKGIIHRDIKPSNILVTLHDGVPVPKVIDFGIAKATTDQRLTDKTIYTAFEQFIGTPAYMSPEQAEMSGLDIDTRSDVYSLGVLLYELLTGRPPFDPATLLKAGMDSARRILREEEPPAPSTRLNKLVNLELTAIASDRRIKPPDLINLVRGDLDWIVMQALAKDRTRRYETANGLAADVRSYLQDEPVTARPPSSWYRLKKFGQRNKAALAAASALGLILALGVIASLVLKHEQNTSLRRLAAAEKAQEQLEKEADLGRPANPPYDDSQAQAIQRKDIKALEQNFQRRKEKYGEKNQITIWAMADLANAYLDAGRFTDSIPLFEKVYALTEGKRSDPNNQWLTSRLIDAYFQSGNLTNALAVYQNRLAPLRGERFPAIQRFGEIPNMNGWLSRYNEKGQRETGIQYLDKALAMSRAVYGPSHPETSAMLDRIAWAMWGIGMGSNSLALEQQCLAIRESILPENDREMLRARYTVGAFQCWTGHPAEGVPILEQVLPLQIASFSTNDPETLWTMEVLANAYENTNRRTNAFELMQRCMAGRMGNLPTNHLDTLRARREVARMEFAFFGHHRLEDIRTMEEVLSLQIAGGTADWDVRWTRQHLGEACGQCGLWNEAETNLTAVMKIASFPDVPWLTFAPLLLYMGKTNEYLMLREQVLSAMDKTTEVAFAERAAKVSLLFPASGKTLEIATRLANSASDTSQDSSWPYFQFCKALGEYRQGNWSEADTRLRRLLSTRVRDPRLAAMSQLLCAMTDFRLANDADAHQWLSLGLKTEREKVVPPSLENPMNAWQDWLILQILRKEACDLIGCESPVAEKHE